MVRGRGSDMAVQGSVNPRSSLDFLIGSESSKLARVSNLLERMELAVPPRGCSGMTTRDQEARIDEALKEHFPSARRVRKASPGAPRRRSSARALRRARRPFAESSLENGARTMALLPSAIQNRGFLPAVNRVGDCSPA